jgi:hypothetical protein
MNILVLGTLTEDGDVTIRECDLPNITNADLRYWDISRPDLHRCFAEGVALMKGRTPSKRVRPVAMQIMVGHRCKWEVELSTQIDPNLLCEWEYVQ